MPPINELVFVTYSSSPSKASRELATKDLVRRQALKSYHSSQGSDQTSARQRESQAVIQKPLKKHTSRFRVPKSERSRSSKSPPREDLQLALPQRVSAFDPFVSSLGPNAWELIDYFRYCFRMKSMSISETEEWFTFAMFNTSLSQATLSLVSLNRDLEAGRSVSAVTLHHRSAAMKLLQQEINGATEADREAVAGTVALLTISEDMEGNKDNAKAHMDGMTTVIRRSGGLSKFRDNSALLKLIAWADLLHASKWLSQPHLADLFVPLKHGDAGIITTDLGADKLVDPVFRSELEKALCPHLRSLIDILHKFPAAESLAQDDADASANFERMLFIIEQLIANLRGRIPYEGYMSALSRSFIVAAQLYVAVNLRQTSLRSPMVSLLKEDLMKEMEIYRIKASREEGMKTWNNVVLWIQTVGGLGADVDGNNQLMEGLTETMAALGIADESEMVEHLSSIAWAPGSCSGQLSSSLAP